MRVQGFEGRCVRRRSMCVSAGLSEAQARLVLVTETDEALK
jgi:hypothetical protein